MSYEYEKERSRLFLPSSQKDFLAVRDLVSELISQAGAVDMSSIMRGRTVRGDTWLTMAAVDRLVELGEIRELKQDPEPMGQYRVFVRVGRGA